jgi:hypothetical protein
MTVGCGIPYVYQKIPYSAGSKKNALPWTQNLLLAGTKRQVYKTSGLQNVRLKKNILKKFTCKGTLRQLFICLRPPHMTS